MSGPAKTVARKRWSSRTSAFECASCALALCGFGSFFRNIDLVYRAHRLPREYAWQTTSSGTASSGTASSGTAVSISALSESAPRGDPERIRPLIWLHFPKCGSSFMATIIHHACGDRIPKNHTIQDPLDPMPVWPTKTPCTYNGKKVKFAWANGSTCRWNSLCGGARFTQFSGGHDPLWLPDEVPAKWSVTRAKSVIGEVWHFPTVGKPYALIDRVSEADLSKVIAIFREPKQRTISHKHHLAVEGNNYSMDFVANEYGACMTQMLLGWACGRPLEDEKYVGAFLFELNFSMVKTIVTRRVPSLGFVGLTDEWDLSVCLFHAMFGGECLPVEFKNVRKGAMRVSSLYDLTASQWPPGAEPLDSVAYSVANDTFWSRVREYNVTPERCEQICGRHFSVAGPSPKE